MQKSQGALCIKKEVLADLLKDGSVFVAPAKQAVEGEADAEADGGTDGGEHNGFDDSPGVEGEQDEEGAAKGAGAGSA
jgi:hypothetical protein